MHDRVLTAENMTKKRVALQPDLFLVLLYE
jgi:hypothetical protein